MFEGHSVKLLIGIRHGSKFGHKGRFHQAVIRKTISLLDRHSPRRIGLETASKRSLLGYAVADLPKKYVLSDGLAIFDTKARETLAKAISKWTGANGSRTPPTALAHLVNAADSFADFKRQVGNGTFGVLEAIRYHAEERGIEVIPLDDRELRKRASLAKERAGSTVFSDPEGSREATADFNQLIEDRHVPIVKNIRAHRLEHVVAGDGHSGAVKDSFAVEKFVKLTNWLHLMLS